ncbi:hypothetical protein J7T55_011312 [Diaporthe amygdali]|uniref:uncharacterized protein n=1 Tax=Phomopsis amygdali TaxID=1214568 RepID=UPI0022FE3C23|nr:uncharacterized protein J7T55_011312 [Diaporthe amygdali]KAJ0108821.1 hypothetical protein J7T55_011312 [Diaporthe amygdali]
MDENDEQDAWDEAFIAAQRAAGQLGPTLNVRRASASGANLSGQTVKGNISPHRREDHFPVYRRRMFSFIRERTMF